MRLPTIVQLDLDGTGLKLTNKLTHKLLTVLTTIGTNAFDKPYIVTNQNNVKSWPLFVSSSMSTPLLIILVIYILYQIRLYIWLKLYINKYHKQKKSYHNIRGDMRYVYESLKNRADLKLQWKTRLCARVVRNIISMGTKKVYMCTTMCVKDLYLMLNFHWCR